MSITVRCGHCGKTARLHGFMAGRTISCESCNQPIEVPKRAEVSTAESVSLDVPTELSPAASADLSSAQPNDKPHKPPREKLHQADIRPFIVKWGLILTLLIGGIGLVVQGASAWFAGKAARSWPTVAGKVLSSSIQSRRNRSIRFGSSQTFDPIIRYTYSIDGKTYSYNRVGFVLPNRNDNTFAKEMLERFPPGSAIDVYVDPADPQNAVIYVESTWGPWIKMAIGSALFAMGAAFYWYNRPDPDTADMQ